MNREVKYDPEANALYVRFSAEKVARTKNIRDNWNAAAVDLAADGSVIGVEFLRVREGIDLRGVPNPQEIRAALLDRGVSLLTLPPSDKKRVERFLDVIGVGLMLHDIQAAIDGKANFLAALGLLDYTEIFGGLVLGDLNASNRDKFEAFLPYLGKCYQESDLRLKQGSGKKRGKGLYSFRSMLVHRYGLNAPVVIRMGISREGRCGIEFDDTKGWDFCVQQYFDDFRRALEKLSGELPGNPILISNFVNTLGEALNL